jgi:Flp pilus assembly secretin CpaC
MRHTEYRSKNGSKKGKAMKNLIASAMLLICHMTLSGTAIAETIVRLKVGGFRTVEPSRPYDNVTSNNPAIVEVIEDAANKSFQLKGIAPGEATVDLIGSGANGKTNTRSFRVLVRPSEKQKTEIQTPVTPESGNSLALWLKREFKNLRGELVGDKMLLSGSLTSTTEFQKLEQMASSTQITFIPNHSIPQNILADVIAYVNNRLARSGGVRATLAQNGNSVTLITDSKKDEAIQLLTARYAAIIPGFDSTLSGNPEPEAQIKVTMHFVESTQTKSSEVSQKFSGANFPLTGELNLRGIEQAPFSYYLKYLNSHMSTRLLQQPAIVTQSGRSAELHSGGDLAYQTATSARSTSTQFRNFGLTAQVTPITRIDGSISMDLELEISEPSGSSAVADTQTLTKRKVKSAVTLDDGMAKLVARLRRQKQEKSSSGPPILEKIPIISWFVTSRGNIADTADLWIFVSATSSLYQDFGDSQKELDRLLEEQ